MANRLKGITQKDFFYVTLLLLVALVAYSGFLFHPCIHDFINHFFPSRFFLTDCLRHGQSPLWNPYQSMGTPAHADPQVGTFYLPAYLFALFGPYHSVCCSIDFIFHAFVGGWGFYRLCRSFGPSRLSSFAFAVCYMLSGFFVANAQHLSWVVAAAWLPWLIYSMLKLFRIPNFRFAAMTAIFASLMFNGGYPGFFFGFAYLVLLFFAAWLFWDARNRNHHHIKNLLLFGGLAVLFFALLSLPTIISYLEVRPLITRGQELDYSKVSHSFPAFSSLLFPYAIASETAVFTSGLTMRSIYVGILTVAFFVTGIRCSRGRSLWLLFAFGVAALLVAYGRALPFHRMIFYVLPLASVVRIPALMRIFFIIPVLLLAAIGLEKTLTGDVVSRKILTVTLLLFSVVSLILFVLLVTPFGQSWESETVTAVFLRKLKIDCLVLFFVSTVAVVCLKAIRPEIFQRIVVLLTVADMVLLVFLFGPITIWNNDLRHRDFARITRERTCPVPSRVSNSSAIQDPEPHLLWLNAGVFFKAVEWESYNPFVLNDYNKMTQPYYEQGLQMDLPLAYFPGIVVLDTVAHILGEDTAYTDFSEMAGCYFDSTASVVITRFEPGRIELKSRCNEIRPLVLAQNFYPGWRCHVDGEPLEIRRMNISMMTVMLPAGSHQVTFEYRKPAIMVAWITETLLLLGLLIYFLVKRKD